MSVGMFQRASLLLFTLVFCVACTHQNPQDLKEKTAHATAELKRDAKAIASGVHEGWSQYKTLDVNTATREQLLTLPGITPADADRITAGRPYDTPEDLVTRHIIPKKKYDRISDLLKVKKR
ncbi:MAG TPA: helix-hairpin-helix domain-containing protein [Terriglobales bacterium]|jgi:competence protein ComEA|nr:helix-hairpin-helix domain-containing protein [Terriglobales bacterium]